MTCQKTYEDEETKNRGTRRRRPSVYSRTSRMSDISAKASAKLLCDRDFRRSSNASLSFGNSGAPTTSSKESGLGSSHSSLSRWSHRYNLSRHVPRISSTALNSAAEGLKL